MENTPSQDTCCEKCQDGDGFGHFDCLSISCPCHTPTENTPQKVCQDNHCHDCEKCGYVRPMTEGEAEIAKGLDEFLAENTPQEKVVEEGWKEGEATAMNIVHQLGDLLYETLPADVAHEHFVIARQATNDRAINFAMALIRKEKKASYEQGERAGREKERERIARDIETEYRRNAAWNDSWSEPTKVFARLARTAPEEDNRTSV